MNRELSCRPLLGSGSARSPRARDGSDTSADRAHARTAALRCMASRPRAAIMPRRIAVAALEHPRQVRLVGEAGGRGGGDRSAGADQRARAGEPDLDQPGMRRQPKADRKARIRRKRSAPVTASRSASVTASAKRSASTSRTRTARPRSRRSRGRPRSPWRPTSSPSASAALARGQRLPDGARRGGLGVKAVRAVIALDDDQLATRLHDPAQHAQRRRRIDDVLEQEAHEA